jgi:hypothetical protein
VVNITLSPGVSASPSVLSSSKRAISDGSLDGKAAAAALGTIAKYSTDSAKDFATAASVRSQVDSLLKECAAYSQEKLQRRYRYFLQEVSASLLQKYAKEFVDGEGRLCVARTKDGAERTKFKVCICGRISLNKDIARAHATTKTAHFKNMVTCGSVWTCPVCSALVSVRRRDEVVKAVDAAPEQGLMVFFMTLTARHSSATRLRSFYEAMSWAHGRLWSGGDISGLKAQFGVVGMISDREVTFSRLNGAHPHIHELVFLRRPELSAEQVQMIQAEVAESVLAIRSVKKQIRYYEERLGRALRRAQRILEDQVLQAFEDVFRARWERVAGEAGLDMDRHGFDVTNSTHRVADYVAKYGHEPQWRDADELTKWQKKLAYKRDESYTPWQLLELASQGDEWAAAMYCEYALVYFGKRQLHWSKGLKKRFRIEDKSDEEVVEEASDEAQLRFVIDAPMPDFRKKVLAARARAQYLELCELGDKEAIIEAIWLAFGFRPFVSEPLYNDEVITDVVLHYE